jgi:histidyl-tRNA synthetase
MRTNRIAATQEVANQLFAVEAAIDIAIAEAAKLSALMPQARVSANLSAVVGQEAFSEASNTLSDLIQARADIIKTHNALDAVKCEIGLRTMSMGGAVNKGAADRMLEVVAEAA